MLLPLRIDITMKMSENDFPIIYISFVFFYFSFLSTVSILSHDRRVLNVFFVCVCCVFVLFEIDGLLAITRNFVFGPRLILIFSSFIRVLWVSFFSPCLCAYFFTIFGLPFVYIKCNAVRENEQSKQETHKECVKETVRDRMWCILMKIVLKALLNTTVA